MKSKEVENYSMTLCDTEKLSVEINAYIDKQISELEQRANKRMTEFFADAEKKRVAQNLKIDRHNKMLEAYAAGFTKLLKAKLK